LSISQLSPNISRILSPTKPISPAKPQSPVKSAIRKPRNSNTRITAEAGVRFDIPSDNIEAEREPGATVRWATNGARKGIGKGPGSSTCSGAGLAGKGTRSTASNKVTEAGNRIDNEAGTSQARSSVRPEPPEEVQTRIGRKVVKKKIFEAGKN
jgi:hypothetical protein